jgi:hypothetical protein
VIDADLVDGSVGYASGFGVVKKTTDGGKTWSALPVPVQGNLSGIDFVDASTGWVSGNATILHTADGGATWTTQPTPTGADAREVRFFDAQNGWAAGALRTIPSRPTAGRPGASSSAGSMRIPRTATRLLQPESGRGETLANGSAQRDPAELATPTL